MATVQVRDVPDEVAEIIAEKASAAHKSVSAYLRDLMAADVKLELQKRAIARWNDNLKRLHAELGMPTASGLSGAEVVREIRDEYERGDG